MSALQPAALYPLADAEGVALSGAGQQLLNLRMPMCALIFGGICRQTKQYDVIFVDQVSAAIPVLLLLTRSKVGPSLASGQRSCQSAMLAGSAVHWFSWGVLRHRLRAASRQRQPGDSRRVPAFCPTRSLLQRASALAVTTFMRQAFCRALTDSLPAGHIHPAINVHPCAGALLLPLSRSAAGAEAFWHPWPIQVAAGCH